MFKTLKNLVTKSTAKTVNTPQELEELIRGYATTNASGVRVTPSSAMRQATVYQCVNVLSEDISALPFPVHKRDRTGKVTLYKDHSLYSLLNNAPNEWQTALEFREMLLTHMLLRGNAYAYVNRISGTVRELIPIHPDMVKVEQGDDLSLAYTVANSKGAQRRYTNEQILHLRYKTLDGISGISPVAFNRSTIGMAQAAESFGARLFKNSGKPSGVISSPHSFPNKERFEKVKEKIEIAIAGEAQHGTLFLDEDMKWTQVSMSPEDSQFLETRKYQKADIAAIYRVPLFKLNDMDGAKFKNVEQLTIQYVKDLLPTLERIEQVVWRDLLNPDEQRDVYVEHKVDGLLRGDIESRYKAHQIAIMYGIMSPNEVRRLENLPPREDGYGDQCYYPANLLPAGTEIDASKSTSLLDDSQSKRKQLLDGLVDNGTQALN